MELGGEFEQILPAIAEGPATWFGALAVRAALRTLPLISFATDWTDARQREFLEVWRLTHAGWCDVAYPPVGRGWSDARSNVLRRLWDAGFTASEIANALGEISRNAVIGKAHRLGLLSSSEKTRDGVDDYLMKRAGEMIDAFDGTFRAAAAESVYWASVTTPLALIGEADLAARRATRAIQSAEAAAEYFGIVTTETKALEYVRRAAFSDLSQLREGKSGDGLMAMPLWQEFSPQFQITFPPDTDNWEFWIDWYRERLTGSELTRFSRTVGTDLDLAVAGIPPEVWSGGSEEVANEIRQRMDELLGEGSVQDDIDLDPNHIGDVESQNPIAIQFSVAPDGLIDVDDSAGADRLLRGEDAVDRHQEVRSAAEEFKELYSPGAVGANQVRPLVSQIDRLLTALGPNPSAARPGLIIPRGERLRQRLKLDDRSDEVGAGPELPPTFRAALEVLVAAYNVYVALDPELARHDEARLPPELRSRLISPAEGRAIISEAIVSGVATPRSESALLEEAIVAPAEPDPGARQSRRYSESVRNFLRAAARQSVHAIKYAWGRKGLIGTSAAGLGAGASWIASHADQLLRLFPPDSPMVSVINFIREFVGAWLK